MEGPTSSPELRQGRKAGVGEGQFFGEGLLCFSGFLNLYIGLCFVTF